MNNLSFHFQKLETEQNKQTQNKQKEETNQGQEPVRLKREKRRKSMKQNIGYLTRLITWINLEQER